jgi:integrase
MALIEERTTKDGKKRYRVRIRLKGHPEECATFRRKTDAKKWEQDTEAAIRAGRYFKTRQAKKKTLANLVDRYIRDVIPTKSAYLQTQQTRQLKWWKAEFGDYTLAHTTPALVAEGRDLLKSEPIGTDGKKRRSNATVNRYLAALSHAFSVAVKEWGWLDSSPVRKVSRLKESRGRVRFLSKEERTRLLKACRESSQPLLYPLVVLALSTGARQGELLALRWSDVDLRRKVIRLEDTKNNERRALPLAGLALELVSELSKVRRIDSDLVFPSKGDGAKPFHLRAVWLKALSDANVEDFRFHDLRHTAASYLAMNGATLAEIAEVLGHKTLAMVKRYAHLTEQHTSKVVERMNTDIFGS